MENPPALGRTGLSGAGALGTDVSCIRDGVLVCIVPGRAKSTAAWTSTSAVAVSSAMIASAAPVTSAATASATAMVASSVPSAVSSIAGFCDSERTLNMG
jgi:hypothetical protein